MVVRASAVERVEQGCIVYLGLFGSDPSSQHFADSWFPIDQCPINIKCYRVVILGIHRSETHCLDHRQSWISNRTSPSELELIMSALGGKADIKQVYAQCLLMTQSGHSGLILDTWRTLFGTLPHVSITPRNRHWPVDKISGTDRHFEWYRSRAKVTLAICDFRLLAKIR